MNKTLFAAVFLLFVLGFKVFCAEDSFRGFKKDDEVILGVTEGKQKSPTHTDAAGYALEYERVYWYWGIIEATGNPSMGINNFIRIKVYSSDYIKHPLEELKRHSGNSSSVAFTESQVKSIEGFASGSK